MNAFLPQGVESTINFIIAHLKDEYYGYISNIPPSDLRKMVANGLIYARQYEFTDLEAKTVFVVWMFIVAPNFHEQAELQKILLRETSANKRIEEVLAIELDSSWQEAQENYNSETWFPELQIKEEGQMEWQQS